MIMKKLFFLFLSVLILISCKKDNVSTPTVDEFVSMIKIGNYDSPYLPNFQPEDIERLLHYSKDFQIIEEFPINLISSYRPNELRLGECLLWTVESVRLNYDESSEIKKYPSLVPQLVIPGGTFEPQIASIDDLNRAYDLYLAWWANNKTKDFTDFRNINPLKDAVLMWR
jgi:hypothetical protein